MSIDIIMRITNKFLESDDFKLVSFQCIRKEFDYIYRKVLKGIPSYYGAKFPDQVRIHWSREWEYPWAIISSEVKAGDKVLDCGCGGSPLLPFLSYYGCEAYGLDTNFYTRPSFLKYYFDLLKDVILVVKNKTLKRKSIIEDRTKQKNHSLENTNTQHKALNKLDSPFKFVKYIISPKIIKKKNDLRRFVKDPNKLGFKIKFFKNSIDKMPFKDESFDKIFCISVIEHLSENLAHNGFKEMVRVLKKSGILVITIDNDGAHVNPKLVGRYKDLIKSSGLDLYGDSNFNKPNPEKIPGDFNVLGFTLKKS